MTDLPAPKPMPLSAVRRPAPQGETHPSALLGLDFCNGLMDS